VVICLNYLKSNYCNKIIRCNSLQRKGPNKVIKQLTFQLYKQLMILCKQEYITTKKLLEIKVKERNLATKKEYKIDLQPQHIQCQDKVVLQ